MSAPSLEVAPSSTRWLRARSLGETYESGADNFLLLRLLAAVLVMYGHSYGFAGAGHGDFISRLNWGKGIYSGSIAVDMFFAISGFLVTGSYVKRHNLEEFLKARALRILPAYVCCIVFSALVLGAIYTELPLLQYWASQDTWQYIYANLWLSPPLEWKLPGVFSHNFMKDTVNGSIWTLPAEVRMYAWVAILGLLGLLRRRWLANVALAALLLIGCLAPDQLPLMNIIWLRLAGFFLAGALCFINRDDIPVSTPLLALLTVVAIATHGTPAFAFVFCITVTYFCLWFAYIPNFHFFNRFGDYSYGVYLWGFPIQQAVSASIGAPTRAWVNCAISLLIVLAIAAASWHWLEHPALRLKKKRIRKTRVLSDIRRESVYSPPDVQVLPSVPCEKSDVCAAAPTLDNATQSSTITAAVLLERLKPGMVLGSTDLSDLRDLLEVQDRSSESKSAVSKSTVAIAHRIGRTIELASVRLVDTWRVLRGKSEPLLAKLQNPLVFFALAFGLQLPLILNAGYYNHDELQWLSFADQPTLSQVPWAHWFDFQAFQYRPLTFNLWLLVSHFLGYQPLLMHLARVLLGLIAAMLLRATLIHLDVSPRNAVAAVGAFLISPYTVYTHAWIGTFADSLFLIFLLAAIIYVLRESNADVRWTRRLSHVLPVAALTALALISKESAITFPVLLLVVAYKRRDCVAFLALAAASLVVAVYLALRLNTILFTPHEGSAYAWQLANIPARLAEFTIFPFLPDCFEAATTSVSWNWAGILFVAVLLAVLFSAGWRYVVAYCIGSTAALGPILILGTSSNHYAYVAGAFGCAFFALMWRRLHAWARVGTAILLLVLAVHGYREMTEMRHIGRIQHNLYEELVEIVPSSRALILIKAERPKEDVVLQHLLYRVPSYRGIPLSGSVTAIPFSQISPQATHLMSGNGKLIPQQAQLDAAPTR